MPITKYSFIVKDVKDLAPTLRRAFSIARSGRPGPVLVDIVLALGVSADELLFDSCTGKEGMINSILSILSDCSEEELCFFNEMAGATKNAFRKYKK